MPPHPPHNDEAHVPLVNHQYPSYHNDDGSDDDDDDDEIGYGPSRSQQKEASRSSTTTTSKANTNRIFIILLLVVLVGISIAFQYEVNLLTTELHKDEDKIQDLTSILKSQAVVIDRFNQSVSNQDVLDQLASMESTLIETQTSLKKQLDTTMDNVETKLNNTLVNLDKTVTNAKKEIHNEVESMKTNFEQYVVQTQDQFSMENSFMVYQLAGTFTLLSCLISMWHMTAHLRKMKQPVIQRKILAILWMSPIYAITSWFSLVFHEAEGYLAIIKDGYEAYIIYQFLSFCISVLGKGDRNRVVDLLAKRADHLTPPFRLCFCCQKTDPYENDTRALAHDILIQCQFFAMQFVLFRPLTTIANVFLNKYEYYGPFGADNPRDYRAPQFYVVLIQNLSIFTAFAGLLKFYHAVDKDLAWCRPFAKFLCIKGVVFMTFWQGLAITILAETTDVGGADTEEWAMSAQNFLICLEMLLFSIAHFYCFPTEEWEENYKAKQKRANLGETIAFGDFVSDIKLILSSSSSTHGKSKKKLKNQEPSEPTVPEEEGEDGNDDGVDVERGDRDIDTEEETSVASDITGMSSVDNNATANKSLAAAIAKNLAKSDDDPEIQEACQRLLENDILSDLSFNPPTPLRDRQRPDPQQDEESNTSSPNLGATTQTANETTGLLSAGGSQPSLNDGLSTGSDDMLRPSIFTTIADLSGGEESNDGNNGQGV